MFDILSLIYNSIDILYTILVLLFISSLFVNDPSAGSPTETLLRLLLPLGDKVYLSSRERSKRFTGSPGIGRSDGRCVQRAGT